MEEASTVMGERGVQALEKAREQCDDEAEFITAVENSIRAGSFVEFLSDIATKMCSIM